MSAHCFGKLPLAGDFLRYQLDSPASRALAGWIERGQALVESVRRSGGLSGGDRDGHKRRFRFMVDQEGGPRVLAGILHESHDKLGGGGSRRFPFVYFVDLPAAPFRKAAEIGLWSLAELWERMEARLRDSAGARDARSFFAIVDSPGLLPSQEMAERDVEERLRSATAGDLWSQVGAGGTADLRVAFFEYLVRILGPHTGRRAAEASVALKLPVSGTVDQVRLQCAFWARLVVGILAPRTHLPHFFLEAPEASDAAKALQIHYKPLEESSFASLMTRQYENDYTDDLTADVPPVRGVGVLSEGSRRLLADDNRSLAELAGHSWICARP